MTEPAPTRKGLGRTGQRPPSASSGIQPGSARMKDPAPISSRVALSSESNSPRTLCNTLLLTFSFSSSLSPKKPNSTGCPSMTLPVSLLSWYGPSTTGTVITFRMKMWNSSPVGLNANRASPSHWKKTPCPFLPLYFSNMSRFLSVWTLIPGFFASDLNFQRNMSTMPSLNMTGSLLEQSRAGKGALLAPCIACACQLML
mmetsp:Transcript_13974/g.36087  ORF Transcript_13974/g.36087 Transcript_13974/m.36087 type:complete len:200 (-) Transcript_13974:1559-2158(-)